MFPEKKYALPLLLAATFCLPLRSPAQTNTDAEAQQHFQLAHQAQAAGQLDTAAAEYQKVIRLKPEVAEGYASLGLVYYAQSKFADSARVLEQAYKLNPKLPGVSLVLGLDSIKLYHPARAIPYLRQAISLEPANKQAQSSLGTALWDAGDTHASIKQLRKADTLFPSDPDILFVLGEAYRKASSQTVKRVLTEAQGTPLAHQIYGDIYKDEKAWQKATGHYQKAIDIDAHWPGAHLGLGEVDLSQDKFNDAEQQFHLELKVNPASAPAYARLAQVALLQNNTQASLNFMKTAIAIAPAQTSSALGLPPSGLFARDSLSPSAKPQLQKNLPSLQSAPSSPQRSLALAMVYAELGDHPSFAAAWNDFQKSALQPAPHANLLQRALLSFNRRDYDRAETDLDTWIKLHPKDLPAQYLLGRTYRSQSLDILGRLVTLAPGSYRTHELMAQTYENSGDNDKALAEYRIAEKLNPNLPGLHFAIGHLLSVSGDTTQAIAELQGELHLNPDHAEANAELGTILVAQHEPDKALPYLQKAIQLQPGLSIVHQELGRAYFMQKNFPKAEVELKQAVQNDPDGAAHYQLGVVYRTLGRTQDAAAEFALSRKIKMANLSQAEAKFGPTGALAGTN